ncbi:MAG: DUF5979 domain-containing protein [Actinomycetaceae bacterium]|nr:DUF5979 domain-containing protein [Actinomycetaceae bacterium]
MISNAETAFGRRPGAARLAVLAAVVLVFVSMVASPAVAQEAEAERAASAEPFVIDAVASVSDGAAAEPVAMASGLEATLAMAELDGSKTTEPSGSQTGTFTVSASGSGTDASSTKVDFTFTCTDGQSGEVTVRSDGRPVGTEKRIAVGAQCTIAEKSSSAELSGFDLVAPEDQTIAISVPGEVVPVSFVNQYIAQTGSFEVTNANATSDGALLPTSLEVHYACSNGSSGTLVVPSNQTAVKGPVLPSGTTCGLVGDYDNAQLPGYSLENPHFSSTVTIRTGTSQLVAITSRYVRLSGRFSVRMDVETDGNASAAGQTFLVDFECTDGTSGTLEVPGDGKAVSGPSLQAGIVCDIAEHSPVARQSGHVPSSNVDRPSVTIGEASRRPVNITPAYSASATRGDGPATAEQVSPAAGTDQEEVVQSQRDPAEVATPAPVDASSSNRDDDAETAP